MKSVTILLPLLGALAAVSPAQNPEGFRELDIGDPAPDFRLIGIDDSRFPGDEHVTSPDLRNALNALLDGKPVPVEVTRPIGCSTKWRTKKAQVLKDGLEKEGRSTNSYLYSEAAMDPLIEALDPEWQGPIPHTLFIKPGGGIGFRHNGLITESELLEKVLEVMTPYYQPAK